MPSSRKKKKLPQRRLLFRHESIFAKTDKKQRKDLFQLNFWKYLQIPKSMTRYAASILGIQGHCG